MQKSIRFVSPRDLARIFGAKTAASYIVNIILVVVFIAAAAFTKNAALAVTAAVLLATAAAQHVIMQRAIFRRGLTSPKDAISREDDGSYGDDEEDEE